MLKNYLWPMRHLLTHRPFYVCVILALTAIYSIQVFTPLRLHPDTVVLLSVADSVAHGGDYLFKGKKPDFPPGYPAFVAILIKMGLPYTSILIGFNIVFLCAGFLALRLVLRRFGYGTFSFLNISILTLFSFVVIRHFTIPLTDICFFAVSMSCLALMESATELHGWLLVRRLILIWIAVTVTLSIRRIGLALVPALLWTMISKPEINSTIRGCSTKIKIAGASLIVLAGAGTAWIVMHFSTLGDWKQVLIGHHFLEAAYGILHFRLRELGEITLNIPSQMLPAKADDLLMVIGALLMMVLLAGIHIRGQLGPTGIYVLGYLLIMFTWPYYDPRFWLPILPLVIAYAGLTLKRLQQFSICGTAAEVYSLTFVAMGIVALLSSTMITFSGQNFPNLYRDGIYRSTYCSIYHSCDRPDSKPIDHAALHVLRVYK